MHCPHCQSDRTKRNGKRKKVQRYICLKCGRSYVDNPVEPKGRPLLGDRPMTSAEKQQAYRDREKKSKPA